MTYLASGKPLTGVMASAAVETFPSVDTFASNNTSISHTASHVNHATADKGHVATTITSAKTQHKLSSRENQEDQGVLVLRRRGLNNADDLWYDLKNSLHDPSTWSRVVELDISRNHLKSLPGSMASLTQLKTLNVSGNCLKAVPPVLYQLPQLQVLILSENQLSHLPEEMPRCLPNLVRLRVVANSIRQIPATIAAWQSMCHLLLNCNQLETIPEAIVAMPSLELLDISHNRLKALPDYLNFPKLSYLNASNNALRHLPSSIAQSQHLSTLDLSRNRLTSLPIDLARLALSQINVCENQLCIIPSDILEKRSTSVLLTGNPLTHDFVGQQQRQISDSLKTFKDMLRHMAGRPWIVHHQHSATTKNSDEMTFAKVDYLTHASPTTWPSKPGIQPLPDNDAYIDHYLSFHAQSLRLYGNNRSHGPFTSLLIHHEEEHQEEEEEGEPGEQQHDVGSLQIQQTNDVTTDENTGDGYGWSPPPCHLLHSLRELAFRTLLNTQHDLSPKATALWPDRVVADIHHIFSCRQCGQPYVKEWVSSVSLKTYRGHPSVVQKQRFCSLSCWRSYVSKYKTKAANRRPVHHPPLPRQGAGGGGGGGGGTWVPGSMQWIMAAVTASEEQGDEDWVF